MSPLILWVWCYMGETCVIYKSYLVCTVISFFSSANYLKIDDKCFSTLTFILLFQYCYIYTMYLYLRRKWILEISFHYVPWDSYWRKGVKLLIVSNGGFHNIIVVPLLSIIILVISRSRLEKIIIIPFPLQVYVEGSVALWMSVGLFSITSIA